MAKNTSRPSFSPRNRLTQERYKHSWSQQEVADQLGTTPLNVSRWERGITTPTLYFRQKLTTLYGLSARELGIQAEPSSLPVSKEVPAKESVATAIIDPFIPLVAQHATFVGRQEALAHLKARLLSSRPPVLAAVRGLPGIGKTTLAVHMTTDEQVRAHYSDGILWAGLGPSPDVARILSHWGTLFGVSQSEATRLSSLAMWQERLRTLIGSRRFLFVFDDAWSLEAALACQVGGSSCGFLLTTRQPQLALRFAPNVTLSLDELDALESQTLLEELAPDVVRAEAEQVQALVQASGGLPLAVTLMGNYLRVQSYNLQPRRMRGAITRLLDASQRLHVSEPQAPGEPHVGQQGMRVSLHEVIALSKRPLAEPTQAMLRALCVFPPKPSSFSEEAALAVSAGNEGELDVLSDAGLLESMGEGRYTLHQSIVDDGREPRADEQAIHRLITYGGRQAELHQRDFAYMEQESPVLLAALEAAAARNQHEQVWGEAMSMSMYLRIRGLFETAVRVLRQAGDAAIALGDNDKRAWVLHEQALLSLNRRDFSQASVLVEEGLPLARTSEDVVLLCELLADKASVANTLYHWDEGKEAGLEGLALARTHNLLAQQSRLLTALGNIALNQMDLVGAEGFLTEGIDIARQLGDEYQVAQFLSRLGITMLQVGNYRRGDTYLSEGLSIAYTLGDRTMLMDILNSLGMSALNEERYVQAQHYFEEALVVTRQVNDSKVACICLLNLAEVATSLEDDIQAMHYGLECLENVRQESDPFLLSNTLIILGDVAVKRKEYMQAQHYLEEALELSRQHKLPWEISRTLNVIGELYLKRHEIEAAQAVFHEMQTTHSEGSLEAQAQAEYGLARVAEAQGKRQEARDLGEQSLALFESTGLKKDIRLVKQWLNTLSL